MFKQIKLAALGLVATSAILPKAPAANAALSTAAQQSVAEIQAEIPFKELIARRFRRHRRHRLRHRRRRRRYPVYRRNRRNRRPFRLIRRRTCYRRRYKTICRYRTYRRYRY